MNAEKTVAVKVRNLEKRSDEVKTVKGVDFEVSHSELFGFLGLNGASKTTTINMLTGLAHHLIEARSKALKIYPRSGFVHGEDISTVDFCQ